MLRSSQRPVLMILRAIILSVWTLVATASLAPLAIAQTWITDQRGMRTANWLFEAIQGDLLLEYAEWEEAWGDQAKESAKTSEFRDARVLWQPHVALTYATSRLVSYVEVR